MRTNAQDYPTRARFSARTALRSRLFPFPDPSVLRRLAPCARLFAKGFLLAAPSVGGCTLPLGACLCTVVPFGARAVCAALGALLGYLLCFPLHQSLEQTTLTLLVLVGTGIFRGTGLPRPLLTGSLAAVIGAVFLLEGGLSGALPAQYLCKLLLAAAAPPLLQRAARGALPGLRTNGADARREPELRALLRRGSAVFAELYRSVQDAPTAATCSETAEMYDFAAEQVCGHCVCRALCWEQEAEQTYRDLCLAAEPILRRGLALREDLSARFLQRCRHTEGFLTAVNQALDESLSRRQRSRRQQEQRQLLADQYLFFSRCLQALSREVRQTPAPAVFRPELAIGSAEKPGGGVSGDRGAALFDRRGNYCVLLCDGMGSGAAARRESDRAVRLLTGLLDLAASPDAALSLLNDYCVLQDVVCFSTVDLLQLDLRTGTGALYKWGAAPSYLLGADGVQTIGAPAPPPGCGAGPEQSAARHPLSLREGETLVMVSDGAFGEQTEARIRAFAGRSVRELAGSIIEGGGALCEDDRTAVVLRLRAE